MQSSSYYNVLLRTNKIHQQSVSYSACRPWIFASSIKENCFSYANNFFNILEKVCKILTKFSSYILSQLQILQKKNIFTVQRASMATSLFSAWWIIETRITAALSLLFVLTFHSYMIQTEKFLAHL